MIKVHTLLTFILSTEATFYRKFKNLWTCSMLVPFLNKGPLIRWIRFRKLMTRKVLKNNLAPMLKNNRNLRLHSIKMLMFSLLLMRGRNSKFPNMIIKFQPNTKSNRNRKYKSKYNKNNNKSRRTLRSRTKTSKLP